MKNYHFLRQKYLVDTYPNRGLVIESGEGIYLKDANGRWYLDMMSSYGANIFGHGYLPIIKAITNQLKHLNCLHGSFTSPLRVKVSQQLVAKAGLGLSRVFWSNSGAESVEAAIKFAVQVKGGLKFLAFRRAFHGKTLGALGLAGWSKYRQAFEPFGIKVIFVPFGDGESVAKVLDDSFTAVVVEPIQGDGGVRVPDEGFLPYLRKITRKYNVCLIVDEVQTGAGRTGRFLASQKYANFEPDIVCMGKGLAAGLPVGATLVNDKVSQSIAKLSHTSTFGGNLVVLSAVDQVLKLLDDKLLSHITKMGDYFMKRLRGLKHPLVKSVQGQGLMIGVRVDKSLRDQVLKGLQTEAVLAIPAAEDVIRFLPPYIIQKKHVDIVLRTLNVVMDKLGN